MALYGWDNEQKDRYIYLLLFHDRRVYVGQSVNPIKRIQAHRRPSGRWKEPFFPLVVHHVLGAEIDAIHAEYAWRWRAHLSDWKPITLDGLTFDFSSFRDRSKTQGEKLPWPFIT